MKRFLSFILSLAIMVSAFPINALVVSADEFSDNIKTSINEDSANEKESSDKDTKTKSSDTKDATYKDDTKIKDEKDIKDTNNNDKNNNVIDTNDIDKKDNVNTDDVLNDEKNDNDSDDNSNNDKQQDEDIQDSDMENKDVVDNQDNKDVTDNQDNKDVTDNQDNKDVVDNQDNKKVDENTDLEVAKKLEETELSLQNFSAFAAPSPQIKLEVKVGETEKPNPEFEGEIKKNDVKVADFYADDTDIVSVKKDAHRVHIKGLKAGQTNVTVTGENGSVVTYNVTVIGDEVNFNKEITVRVGEKSETNFPFDALYVTDYFFNSEGGEVDLKWGWLDLAHTRFTVTGVTAGTTYLTLKHYDYRTITYKINVIPTDAKYYVLLPDQTIKDLGKEEAWQYVPNNKIKIDKYNWTHETGIPGKLYSINGVVETGYDGLRDYNGFGSEYVSNPDKMGGFKYNGIHYDLNSHDIDWYKIKYHKSEYAYHVDGYIKDLPVEVVYRYDGYNDVPHKATNHSDGKVHTGDTITLANNDYTKFKNGTKVFKGWNISVDGEEKEFNAGDSFKVMNSTIITPVWEEPEVPVESEDITYKYGDKTFTDTDGAIVGEKYTVKTFESAFPQVTLPVNNEFTSWKVVSGSDKITDNLATDNTITVNNNSGKIILEAVIKQIPSQNIELSVGETKDLTATVPFDTAEINGKTEQENNAVTLSHTGGNTLSITGANEGTTQVVLKQNGKKVEICNVKVITKEVPVKYWLYVGYDDDAIEITNTEKYGFTKVDKVKVNSNFEFSYDIQKVLSQVKADEKYDNLKFSNVEIGGVYEGLYEPFVYDNSGKAVTTIKQKDGKDLKIVDVRLIFDKYAKVSFKGETLDGKILPEFNLQPKDYTVNTEIKKITDEIDIKSIDKTIEGYTFKEWSVIAKDKTTIDNVLQYDITIVAKFAVDKVNVTYKSIDVMDMQTALTGVTKLPALKEADFGSPIKDIINGVTPEKHGYKFLGWRYKDSEIENQIVPTNNIELVAHFERSLFNVNYSYVGIADEDIANIKNFPQNAKDVEKGTPITLDNLTLNGYHFLGWFDEQDNKVSQITVNKDYNLTAKFAKDATVEYVFYSLESGHPHKDTVVVDTDKTYEGANFPLTAENIKEVAENHLKNNKINNFRYLGNFQVIQGNGENTQTIYSSQDIENSKVKNLADVKLVEGKNYIYVGYDKAHNITVNYIQINGETQKELGSYQINDVFSGNEVAVKDGYENNAGFISNNYLLADGYKLIKTTLGDYENGAEIPNPYKMGEENEVINVFYAKDDGQWKNINVDHVYNADRNIQTSKVSFSQSKVINQNYDAAPILNNNNVKYVLSSVTVNGVNAQLVDGKIAGTITDNMNVIFTYDVDANGDSVADKNQATFTFKSADEKMGKVVGEVTQVVTNENGKTFKVTSNVTTIVEAGYKFSNWTAEVQGKTLTFANFDAIKASEFLTDVTFTANWEAVLSGGGGGGSNRPHRPSRPGGSNDDTSIGETPIEVIEIPDLPTPLEQNPIITTVSPYTPSQQTIDVIVDIEDEDTPLSEKPEDNGDLELIEIEDETVPLTSTPISGWALVNLILTVFTVLSSILLIFKNKNMFKTLSIIPAIGSVIAFILTENITNPMVIKDKWTFMMFTIALIQVAVIVLSAKGKKDDDRQSDAK